MRFKGLGPISKWVDDHVFFRIPILHITRYNQLCEETKTHIQTGGGRHHTGGRIWFSGQLLSDGRIEEFNDNMLFPIQDLSLQSPRSSLDASFSCNLDDINRISQQLGVPWDPLKD